MKNYLIIGGSSGIGKALSESLSTNNKIWATYFAHKSESTENLFYHPLDVTSYFSLDFLPETLDGIVYCPGSLRLSPFHRIHPEDFAKDFDLQVLGAIKVIQAVLPKLKKNPQASILLFSTVAAQRGFTFHSQVSVSKGAIEGLTKALAAELAPKIRVNCIAPSLTNTPLAASLLDSEQKTERNNKRHPLQRIGEAKDIAEIAAFLLEEKSSWITGQIIHVDGGISTLTT